MGQPYRADWLCTLMVSQLGGVVVSFTGFVLLVVAQLIMGIAQAGVFPAACSAIAQWMPVARRSISCAILASGMQVGAILASVLTGPILNSYGWRSLFGIYAVPAFSGPSGSAYSTATHLEPIPK